MKRYALLLAMGAISLSVHAQVSGKTTFLNPADYDTPADTSQLTPVRLVLLALLPLASSAPGGDSNADEILHPSETVRLSASNPSELTWNDDLGGEPDSGQAGADLPVFSAPTEALAHQRDDLFPPTLSDAPASADTLVSDESGFSGEATLWIDENSHLGEPWQYVGWRERQFLHIRFEYIDWLAQINGTDAEANATLSDAGSEANDWTTVGWEEDAFAVVGKTSDVPDDLDEQQIYLADWEWYFREATGPEGAVGGFGHVAVVTQGWRTFTEDYGLLRLSGVTLLQQGDEQSVQVIQWESAGYVRAVQGGEANTALLTQTTSDNSVDVTQLGVNNSVTTNQTVSHSLAVFQQSGAGQTIRFEQTADDEGRGGSWASVIQVGNGNTFDGAQAGSNNRLTGLEETLPAEQTGVGHLTSLDQDGTGNVLMLRQEGENQRGTVVQGGEKNRATVSQSSASFVLK